MKSKIPPRYTHPKTCICFNCMGLARWVSKYIHGPEGYLAYCTRHRSQYELMKNDYRVEFIDREKAKDDE